MCATFDQYAAYYDLIYADKPYGAEAEFVAQLIRAANPEARTILELGCGTAAHAVELARRGFEVCGLDQSAPMVERARTRLARLREPNVHVALGDIRTSRLGRCFDAVISLFHVVSYQVSDEDLAATFETAAAHLAPGGVFVFDAWYGPAVLAERPSARSKQASDDKVDVLRRSEPELHLDAHRVDVTFTLDVTDRRTGATERLHEQHRLRYLFLPEVETALARARLRLVRACEWLTGRALGPATWGATFAAARA